MEYYRNKELQDHYRNTASKLREVIRHMNRQRLSRMSPGQRTLLWAIERWEQMCVWQSYYISLFGDSHLTSHKETQHGNC